MSSLLDRFSNLHTVGALLGSESDISFVSIDECLLIHQECVERFGGMHGIRGRTLLESAVFKPMQIASYGENVQIHEMAASLCYGLVKNHAFFDGNKRAAFFSLALFLGNNGLEFSPDPSDALFTMQELASGGIDEKSFSAWVQQNTPNIVKTPKLKADTALSQGVDAVLPVSKTGFFSGKILDVGDGIVIQKTGRHGESVRHAVDSLSRTVIEGEIVDINYVDGVGIVGGKDFNDVGDSGRDR